MLNKLSQFWQELRRRRVIKLITMYAATAFIIMEAGDIMLPRLGLPDWTVTFVIILLIVGFPIAIILSWIFDVTPKGVVRTESLEEMTDSESAVDSQTSFGSKRISISNIIIALLLVVVCILLYPRIFRPDRFKELRNEEGMITVAILPFNNLTGDSSLYFWQNGISEYLVNRLGSSQELAVSSSQVVFDVLEGIIQVNGVSLSPEIARKTASKVKASTYITGGYIGSEEDTNIMLNLVNTGNGELIWSTSVDGNLSTSYRTVLDHLSDTVRNYLEIKVLEEKVEEDLTNAYPNSSDAYRSYIVGLNAIVDSDYESAIESLKMAYELDTSFTFAAFYLAFAHSFGGVFDENLIRWTNRAHELKNNLPPTYRPWIEFWYACFISEDITDIRRYLDKMYNAALHSRFLWFDLAVTYAQFLDDNDKAISAFEKLDALNREWEDDWKYDYYYLEYTATLLKAGRAEEVDRIADIGLKVNPMNERMVIAKGAADIMLGDSTNAQIHKEELRGMVKGNNMSEAATTHFIGMMHILAKDTLGAVEYFRRAYEMDTGRLNSLHWLIYCQLRSNLNFEECLRMSEYGIEKEPDNWQFHWYKGLSLHKLGRRREALAILRETKENYVGFMKELKADIKEIENTIAIQERD